MNIGPKSENWALSVDLVGLKAGRHEMGNLGLGCRTELPDAILNDPVRIRYAFVLSEVLESQDATINVSRKRPASAVSSKTSQK